MEVHPTSKFKRVNFSNNTNNKLLCNVFSLITPLHKSFLLSETCDIRISDQHFCYAKVVKTQTTLLKNIVENGLHMNESGFVNDELYVKHMESLYIKKPWWSGENTAFQIVHFEKVKQLSIFEDGLYPTQNEA